MTGSDDWVGGVGVLGWLVDVEEVEELEVAGFGCFFGASATGVVSLTGLGANLVSSFPLEADPETSTS